MNDSDVNSFLDRQSIFFPESVTHLRHTVYTAAQGDISEIIILINHVNTRAKNGAEQLPSASLLAHIVCARWNSVVHTQQVV